MVRISLTPIIDVVFILLIFFMLATNFQQFNKMNIKLSTESSSISTSDKKIFVIKFNQDGNYLLNDTPATLDVIEQNILSTDLDDNEYLVVIKPEKNTHLQKTFSVIESLNNKKIENITLGITKNENEE
ncbi:MAG: hypothetical protein CMD88_05365 [Gammaproteobacteria bacterium]|nr:hypothetical protein [Gammaproteobacteria bacterium]|tara:strand:+ start:82426 stop:82812 length:387 start_codon:yes stop_codon:yes gene_type:complete